MVPPVVAVTGSSGFIGSHVCKNLVEHGYTVRACVRDKHNTKKTAHLLAMNHPTAAGSTTTGVDVDDTSVDTPRQRGSLELHEADMMVPGVYDDIVEGCSVVFHVAGNFGTDPRWWKRLSPVEEALGVSPPNENSAADKVSYDQGVYDSYLIPTRQLLDSISKSTTVRRLIYTSSGCAERCIADEEKEDDYTVNGNAYGKGKVDCERLLYSFGEAHPNILCASSCPTEVLGPILAPHHDTVYQHRLGEMFAGKYNLPGSWNTADVRDIAETQRRMAESTTLVNGSRFYNGSDKNLPSQDLLAMLRELFPSHADHIHSGENESESDSSDDGSSVGSQQSSCCSSNASSYGVSQWAEHRTTVWSDPTDTLGLQRRPVAETVKDTIDALMEWNCINRSVTTAELKDYYNVAEMDGCEQEKAYLLAELRKRGEGRL